VKAHQYKLRHAIIVKTPYFSRNVRQIKSGPCVVTTVRSLVLRLNAKTARPLIHVFLAVLARLAWS